MNGVQETKCDRVYSFITHVYYIWIVCEIVSGKRWEEMGRKVVEPGLE